MKTFQTEILAPQTFQDDSVFEIETTNRHGFVVNFMVTQCDIDHTFTIEIYGETSLKAPRTIFADQAYAELTLMNLVNKLRNWNA